MPTVTINGFKHYYEEEGSGDAIFMLPAALGSAHNFEAYLPILSKKLRVIAVDMRGMGRSEHVKELSPSAWTDDLLSLMDHLGIRKAHLFGNRLGTRIPIRVGIFHPERALSLILDSPHIHLTQQMQEAQNRAGGDGTKHTPERQVDLRQRHGEDWLDVVRNYYNIRNVSELQEFYNFTDNIDKISCPVLTMSGDNAGAIYDHALEIRARVPNARLAIIPSFGFDAASGFPQTSVEATCKFVLGFVESLAPAPA